MQALLGNLRIMARLRETEISRPCDRLAVHAADKSQSRSGFLTPCARFTAAWCARFASLAIIPSVDSPFVPLWRIFAPSRLRLAPYEKGC